jgi:hypothetical protein
MNNLVAISAISFISYKAINYIYNNNKIILFKITYNYHYCLVIIQNIFYKKKLPASIMNRKDEKVSYVFMLVEYITPILSIPIKISKQDYCVGNKILSQKYIEKYLRDINKEIDTKYTIKIMDENFNEIYLDNKSYILLEKDNYYKIDIKLYKTNIT